MRILKLTDAVARRFIARRRAHDAAAEKVSARILAGVRGHGDAALFRWSERLDGLRLTRDTVWIGRGEVRAARRGGSRELLRAIEHPARNIRSVAELHRPKPWSMTVEPAVRVAQRVMPLDCVGRYVPGGGLSL